MSKQRAAPRRTKKHLARAERQRIQRNWILATTVTVAVLVVGLLVYGFLIETIIIPRQPVATVDGEEISTREFRLQVLFQAGVDTDIVSLGARVLQDMIDGVLIRHEAAGRGIVVPEADIDKAIAEAFGYYPDGTPTPRPTRTVDPTLDAQPTATVDPTMASQPTPTAKADDIVTATTAPTSSPAPSATPYTREAFESNLDAFLVILEDQVGARESDYRKVVEGQLLRERFRDSFEAEVPREELQVQIRHIQLADEQAALSALERLEQGESWDDLALELSEDLISRENGGVLGWFTRRSLTSDFGAPAEPLFDIEVGTTLGPVQIGDAWHLVGLMDRDTLPLGDSAYAFALEQALLTWLNEQRTLVEIEIAEDWISRLPSP